jgi:ankyrin repeat protein
MAVVQCLVELYADVDKACLNGFTPLLIAVQWGHVAVVKYLVEQGYADKNKGPASPLFLSIQYKRWALAQYLVAQGVDVNKGTDAGFTPLAAALRQGNVEMAAFLRAAGAI